ncbi:hypothetical protein ACEQG5_006173 [Pseudomonas aeruginosa]
MEIKNTLCALLVAVGVSVGVAGCASKPKYTIADMQNPETTPVEKWSEAMVYARAIGIMGLYDFPSSLAVKEGYVDVTDGTLPAGGADVITTGLSISSPPSGMSSGTAAGVGIGLMLFGGAIGEAYQRSHVAAWVPADLASSADEATALMLREYEAARVRAFPKGLSKVRNIPGKYHDFHVDAYARKMPVEKNRVQIDGPPQKSPAFLKAPMSYGPIILDGTNLSVDGMKNNLTIRETMLALSNELPDWFVLYSSPRPLLRVPEPPFVYRAGKEYLFIGK